MLKRIRNLSTGLKILALIMLLIFLLKGVFTLGVLIALSIGVSFLINNFPIRQLGIELVTFIGVLTGIKYGPFVAVVLTFILITYHMIAGGFLGTYVLWVIPAYCIGAAIAGIFKGNPSGLGIIVSLGINANNLFFTGITSPGYLVKYLPFSITNILFNVFLFSIFSEIVLKLMG